MIDTQYSGTSLPDLLTQVNTTLTVHGMKCIGRISLHRFESEAGEPEFLDNTEAVLRGLLAPEMFLADVLMYLANRTMSFDDRCAWHEIKNVQECIFAGMTRECATCGDMEGNHANVTNLCPDGRGTFSSQPATCRALLTRGPDDEGSLCDAKSVTGSQFCAEHDAR